MMILQITSIKQDMWPSSASDSSYLRQEIRQLREDLRQLRDANHTLTQDNIKLTEYIRDVERVDSNNRQNGKLTFKFQANFVIVYQL